MDRRPAVVLLMRKESVGYYSIERLFESLIPFFGQHFAVKIMRVPCHSNGMLHCFRNLIFAARLRADVIHVTGDIYYCALAVRRRQCVLTMHDLCSVNRLTGLRKLILRLFWYSLPLRWTRYITAISEETRGELERQFGTAIGKIELIPNCVDEAFKCGQFSQHRPGRRQVLQIGTGMNKNLERVAAAVAGLSAHLRIIGRLSRDQITFLNSLDLDWSAVADLSTKELVDEYLNSDVLIFASIYEGFGLPIIEAQAIGVPVVTSDFAPMTDTAGDAALFVDPYDNHSIRTSLERLFSSRELSAGLVELGKKNVGRFDAKAVAGQYAAIYWRILGARK